MSNDNGASKRHRSLQKMTEPSGRIDASKMMNASKANRGYKRYQTRRTTSQVKEAEGWKMVFDILIG
jgi:hypothetical protein